MQKSYTIAALLIGGWLAFGSVARTGESQVAEQSIAHAPEDVLTRLGALEDRVRVLESRLKRQQQSKALGRGLIQLESIVANLKSTELNRYIRVAVVLQIEEANLPAASDAFTELRVNVKDWMYQYLSDKTTAAINGAENQRILREELMIGLNKILVAADHPRYIKAVLFDEINVQ